MPKETKSTRGAKAAPPAAASTAAGGSTLSPVSVAAVPALPDELTTSFSDDPPIPPIAPPVPPLPFPPIHIKSLRGGCYLTNFTPTGGGVVTYDGTMRIERNVGGVTASGDLYQRKPITIQRPFPLPPLILPGFPPNPAAGIPVFARGQYRYYLRVTTILEHFTFGNSFSLGFERHRFNAGTNTWTNEGAFTAQMSWLAAPAGFPSSGDYLAGDVKNSGGVVVGRLTMGWVSPYLRKVTVEIDRVSVSEAPLNNGAGVAWQTVFDLVGWQVTVANSNADVVEPSGESWSNAEMHAAMLARRDSANLDVEWRYHILAVRKIDATPRGIMYDNGGTDSNNVPREGIGIASHWIIPNTSEWGLVKGQRFGAAAKPYFRTALHEIGHAMGLYHNTVDMGVMNTTDVIAAGAVLPTQFPDNIKWAHAADDSKRLRHMPDPFVRPGGIPFGTAYSVHPISPDDQVDDANGLELRVTPVMEAVPIGAPVRVELQLVNISDAPQVVPSSLSMSAGFVKGSVTDPSGTTRTFSPIVLCVDDAPLKTLAAGESMSHSITLLRGGEGALFPAPGLYRIVVEAEWDCTGFALRAAGDTDVIVTSAANEGHGRAALKVLSTPDTLLTLVFGGDHLPEGQAAVEAALADTTLHPHYAFVQAKRLGERFGARKADMKSVASLIDRSTVMSEGEIKKAAELLKSAGKAADAATTRGIVKTLKDKAVAQGAGDQVHGLLNEL